MNNDISLSQTLGGLRIANPDEDVDTPPSESSLAVQPVDRSPSPLLDSDDTATPIAPQPPPASSHSSSSTITEKQLAQTGTSLSQQETSSSTHSQAISSISSQSPSVNGHPAPPSSDQQYPPRLVHRSSMPIAHQAQQQLQYAPNSSSTPQVRNYIQTQSSMNRPVSGFYDHPNLSSSSQPGSYRYRDEPLAQNSPINVNRSASRAAAVAMPAGVPTRESSRSDRNYRPQMPNGGISPLPPRRSSQRIPMGMGEGSSPPTIGQLSGSPYVGGPLPSADDWQERGAAVGIRREIDQNGNPVQRLVKKGVKDFNFGRTLGEGSYSTVLAATDRQTLREYAIKVLDKNHIIKEKKVKYVNIEKEALNQLTEHPGIVRLYYTFQDKRSLYFVLDLASGGELLGVLKKMGTFDEECTRFYGAQILDAISYMHSRGVIHRDLKPENVLLDDQMHVKITDFGTAKILPKPTPISGDATPGDLLDGAETSRALSFVGTAEYVSPELLNSRNACKASDLWAFGCIIYQLLAGRPPFKAANEYLTFQKIVNLEYTFPEGFPEIAKDLVERLLVSDPDKRLPIEHIRNHQFFDGVQWGTRLWKQKAPRLKSYVPPAQQPIKLNGNDQTSYPPNISMQKSMSSGNALRPQPRLITELPPPSQLDIEWSPVLTRNNERILKLGNLVVTSAPPPHSPSSRNGEYPKDTSSKLSRLFGGSTTKKRQRLVMITSSARVILAAAGGDEKKTKMEISLLGPSTSWKSFKDSKGLTAWCIDTRDKHLVFEDPKTTISDPDGSKYSTQEWLDSIERAKELAISQSMTNSYSGDTNFNDLSSTLSSPASTLGGDAALDAVNIPTTRHLRKEQGDNESIKGRKRFSKRHSKNGLSAVF
ncbi:kinase-like protein [Patellaria atrata CBS 101060]|uniref:non-specific serine/threonine protein kinase n=1 Tax=Patellaria atrata CBS 101060 TaxID=1346257 RepID=A0A9P4SD46_9PEZI|nr:kinase-like protein [Patellaria atrata CBS 101060]